jgi:hypothetical protein
VVRVESLRDLIEVYDREVVMLERKIHQLLRDDPGYECQRLRWLGTLAGGLVPVTGAAVLGEGGPAPPCSGRTSRAMHGDVRVPLVHVGPTATLTRHEVRMQQHVPLSREQRRPGVLVIACERA